MKRTIINSGVVVTPHRTLAPGYVVVQGGKIIEVGQGPGPVSGEGDFETIDAGGRIVAPGFVDIHTHGAGGHDFMDGTEECFAGVGRMHARHGTTTLYPTTLTSGNELMFTSFDLFRQARAEQQAGRTDGPNMPGLHLEGPYFAPKYQGAQDPRYLRMPRPDDYNAILERGQGLIARWSMAPELDGALDFGRMLLGRGIIPSIGHTSATFDQAVEAFESGFRILVHFFSCMSTIVRREDGHRVAGVLEAGYTIDDLDVEIIGDGIHVYGPLLRMIHKIKGADHIALVSDSMRAAGMPPEGDYTLGSIRDGRPVIIEQGVAKLPDGSAFASSIVTMDTCVRTALKEGIPLTDAVKMAATTPARIMGATSKGVIAPGYDADMVIFDQSVQIALTMVGGRVVYRIC